MIEKLMKRYALSEQGAKDFVKCTAITTLQNLMLMLSVAVEYYLVAVLLQGNMTGTKKVLFVLACAATLLLFLWIVYLQYNSSFFATYKESEKRRIHIAEKLRELQLSFFGKKDLSDLTSTILGDCTVLEHNFSHVMPQFFGAIISTVIVGIGLFFFDWRMAITSLWVLCRILSAVKIGCTGSCKNTGQSDHCKGAGIHFPPQARSRFGAGRRHAGIFGDR